MIRIDNYRRIIQKMNMMKEGHQATGWNNKKARIGATISSIRYTAHLNTETH
jgi:hypothetical protein